MDNILRRIQQATLKFLVPLTVEDTYRLVVHEAIEVTKAQFGSIFLMEDGQLKRVYASSPLLHQIKIRKNGTTYKTFRSQEANVTDAKILYQPHPQFKKMNLKSILSIPLTNSGKSIGVLSVQSTKDKHFTAAQLEALKTLGSLASLAIRKSQLYDEVKQALEARDLFISMAAHELRTPITTISGYAQLLYSKFAGSDSPESKWIADLSWETIRLGHLVNELLEVERIKKGSFQYIFKECSLIEVIRRATADFRMTHSNREILLNEGVIEGQDIIIGDFDKLIQMMLNLLDNAAKFSSETSVIEVHLAARKNYFKLEVTDQGKGIPKEQMSMIFEKYYQGDTIKEGMGLGLFLVKTIVKQHRGDIKITSRENKGSKITINLPRPK